MQGNSASVVTVFPARPIDAGSYTCTGTNQRETDSSTTGVTVSGSVFQNLRQSFVSKAPIGPK